MILSKKDVVAMFVALGYLQAKTWNAPRMRKHLVKIADLAEHDVSLEDEHLDKVFRAVVEKDGDVEVSQHEETCFDDDPVEKEEKMSLPEPKPNEDNEDVTPEVDNGNGTPEPSDDELLKEQAVEPSASVATAFADQEADEKADEESISIEKPEKKKRGRPKGSKGKVKEDKPKEEKVEKDKPKKEKKSPKPRENQGPKIGDGSHKGIRSLKNRLFCAGTVLKARGLEVGLTQELVDEVDETTGRSNKVASRTQLSYAWHVVNGFLNG